MYTIITDQSFQRVSGTFPLQRPSQANGFNFSTTLEHQPQALSCAYFAVRYIYLYGG